MEVSRKQWILPWQTLLAVCCWLHDWGELPNTGVITVVVSASEWIQCAIPKKYGKPLRNPWESERTARQVLDSLWLFADCVVTCATIKSDKWVCRYIHCRDGPWVSFIFKSYKSWWQDGARKLRTTAAFKDEGTSAVEMSVEAALYGVTWSQQIQSGMAKPMLVDDYRGLYHVILSIILGTITINFPCRS